jgi:polyhydroxyalkanoate synthesis regulator phasin
MPEELETILRLVAEGKLTPDEAAPIIDALTRAERPADESPPANDRLGRRLERAGRRAARANERIQRAFRHADERLDAALSGMDAPTGRQLRIRVTERGRQVVNLRIPIGFVDAALGFVPGLGGDQSDRIRQAVRSGAVGPIVDVEDPDGDGVLISLE